MLMHFDPSKKTVICTDASDVGIAAVLCHYDEGGYLKPVWYLSRMLTVTERKYPILHRELLAIMYAAEKFYKFIFSLKVTVFTDHKPLIQVFKKGLVLSTVHTRVQRYLLRLNPFDIEVVYKEGKMNVLADFASRYPLENCPDEEDLEEEKRSMTVNVVQDKQLLNLKKISEIDASDPEFEKLKKAILTGVFAEVKAYTSVKKELVIVGNLITCSGRVIIPEGLRKEALEMLHEHHVGIVRMKQLARRYIYWPTINKDIENLSSSCVVCKEVNFDKRKKVFVPWPEPKTPFERVHIDFFHFDGKQFLLLVDAYSKWVKVVFMKRTDAKSVIAALKQIFDEYGDPGLIVSDNGPPFDSRELTEFCESLDVKLVHSPPYNPPSNGEAERWVQTVKDMMKKNMSKYDENILGSILRTLRNTPTTERNIIPSEMLLKSMYQEHA